MEWAISYVLGSRWDLEGRMEGLAVLGGTNKKEAKAGMIKAWSRPLKNPGVLVSAATIIMLRDKQVQKSQ